MHFHLSISDLFSILSQGSLHYTPNLILSSEQSLTVHDFPEASLQVSKLEQEFELGPSASEHSER